MKTIDFPISKIEGDKFQVTVSLCSYDQSVITAAMYKFSDRCFIHQLPDSNNNELIIVTFESKDSILISNDIPKQFCNELIDQQIRHYTDSQFGKIRDMIVEEAFKPVNK